MKSELDGIITECRNLADGASALVPAAPPRVREVLLNLALDLGRHVMALETAAEIAPTSDPEVTR